MMGRRVNDILNRTYGRANMRMEEDVEKGSPSAVFARTGDNFYDTAAPIDLLPIDISWVDDRIGLWQDCQNNAIEVGSSPAAARSLFL